MQLHNICVLLTTVALAAAQAQSITTTAPLAGQTLSNGAYVCNPAHQYPTGQTCVDGPTPTLSSVNISALSTTAFMSYLNASATASATDSGGSCMCSCPCVSASSTSNPVNASNVTFAPFATFTGGANLQHVPAAVFLPALLAWL